ncbi:calycin-like domain-containing protein [Prevotella merdae]|uniref:calycin-like domain-containing protein n=1 Tax=Prevotella merdae TaxID=2079531 RepID=UPI003F821F57
MKKYILALTAFAIGMLASAQGIYQFTDPSFETWSGNNTPGNEWRSFESAVDNGLGKFFFGIGKSASPKPSKVEGTVGNSALKLFSKDVSGKNANGNLTTGVIAMGSMTPESDANYNFSDISAEGKHLVFAGTPDKVSFYAKFKSGGSANARGRFILHDAINYRDPDVVNGNWVKVNNESLESHRVGEATILVPATEEWRKFEADFTYYKKKPTTQYMLASLTTNPVPGGSKDDEFFIDDIQFTYYSTLKSLSYKGATINFSEATTSYDLSSETYDASKLKFKEKGAGATASLSYDNETAIATITVKGNDISVNSANQTVYTIQFAQPAPQEVVTTYKNDLSVRVLGSTNQPAETNINLIESKGTYSLELKNFVMDGLGVGNIKVTNLDVADNTYTTSQTITITKGDDPSINDWMGPGLGEVPVNVVATVNGDQMVAQITIKNFYDFGNINVTFAPTVTIGANASVSTEAGVNNVIVNRTFAKGWNTVCLPFDVAVTSLQATKAQEFVSSNGSSLTFNEVADGVLKANVPYLVFFSNEVSDPFYYGGKVEATNPTPVEHNGFTFVGNYEASKSMQGLYGVASEGDVQKIMLGTAASTLPATCAYFTTKNLNANGLRICFDGGEVTGINQVNGAQAQSAGAVYNLQGIKVSNRGTNNLPAGLYIMQGKKVIVK